MMEGADERTARFCCETGGMGADAVSEFLLLLENMAPCLDESARISYGVGQPHFVMNVRSGAAPCRSELSDGRAFFHFSANSAPRSMDR